MSWVKIWVHLVFTTKDHHPFLDTSEKRKTVFQHILKNGKDKNIYLDCVNGFSDHVHCLVSLGKEQSISQVAHLIKGESSYWINKNNITGNKFTWQDDYWAVSVGNGHYRRLRIYIHNQEIHHGGMEVTEEMEEFEIQNKPEYFISEDSMTTK